MTSPKPTRQQVEVALRRALHGVLLSMPDGTHIDGTKSVEVIADILVRAGYAEEPREEGWYWVKHQSKDAWILAHYREGPLGWSDGMGDYFAHPPVAVHPVRITPPEER